MTLYCSLHFNIDVTRTDKALNTIRMKQNEQPHFLVF